MWKYVYVSFWIIVLQEDVNIIAVDWANGARPPYLQATANARLVGAQIARMMTYLEQKADLKTDDIHVIAHSLGGHVSKMDKCIFCAKYQEKFEPIINFHL